MQNRFKFRPDLSNGLTGEEIVTMPNLIILGGLMAVKRDRAPMLPLVSKAMKSIFNDPKSPFISVRVMDILFDGVGFNCDGEDFSAKAVCAAIKSEGIEKGIRVHNETFVSFSILGGVSNKNQFIDELGSSCVDGKCFRNWVFDLCFVMRVECGLSKKKIQTRGLKNEDCRLFFISFEIKSISFPRT
jgi:hypothetical protein